MKILPTEPDVDDVGRCIQDIWEILIPVLSRRSKFIIAIDFGTTFSSVAFVRLEHPNPKTHDIGAESMKCIDNFPDMPPGMSADVFTSHQSVPTELVCYAQK